MVCCTKQWRALSEADSPAREAGQICQARASGSGGDGPDHGPHDDDDYQQTINRVMNYNYRSSQFIFVKSTNTVVPTFGGTHLNTNPYMLFYKSLRTLTYSQGEDGELLLEILDEIEKCSKDAVTSTQLKELTKIYLKVAEFNRAMLTALLIYTTGIIKGMVEYGVHNGRDAWRRLFHHYLPLADDLQQLLIKKPVRFLAGPSLFPSRDVSPKRH